MKFYMCNVVNYDGEVAYTSKFVLRVDENDEVDAESVQLVKDYLSQAGCELLKIYPQNRIYFEEIVALKTHEEPLIRCAYGRFLEMYFGEIEVA